jgi:iron complex transport system ATP-binding protein
MPITAENVSFYYNRKQVLNRISFSMPDGAFGVILGQNGSGKSTLLKIMSGLLSCQAGCIRIDDFDLKELSSRRRSQMIGFLPQHVRLAFPFCVEDIVMTGRAAHVSFYPGKHDRQMVWEAMERTGTLHLRKQPFTEISGGEQQLVRIARLLSQAPKRILLDEPTTHLDLCNQTRVLNLLKELVASGVTVVCVLHDPSAAFIYGDKFVYLKSGKRFQAGEDEKPWDQNLLQEVYETPLECVPYRGRALVAPVISYPDGQSKCTEDRLWKH